MVLRGAFHRVSTSSLTEENKLPAATLFKGRPRNNTRTSSLDTTPLLPPASNDASSSYQYPLTHPESDRYLDRSVIQDENDIVIAIMGLTGSGKSSFVNEATRRTEVLIGHDLASQTHTVQSVRCTHPDGLRSIVLVDTPGFDDTHLSDAETLSTIANWLKESYQKNIKLAGILYLHRISDVRMARTPLRNLKVFKNLCGNDNLKNIILVTTMWDDVDDQIGLKREEELVSSFWKDMMRLGSRTYRYQATHDSAWEIINQLDLTGSSQRCAPLRIQREMVDRNLPLHETAASKTLSRSLREGIKRVWANICSMAHWSISPGGSSGSFRQTGQSSTGSSSLEIGRSVISLTDTSSIASGISTHAMTRSLKHQLRGK